MKRNRMYGVVVLLMFAVCATVVWPAVCLAKAAPKKVQLTLYCGPLGYSSYALSVGLSEIVNKYSQRIRIRPVETKSNTQSFVEWSSLPPEKQKYAMGVVYPLTVYKARKGEGPFKRPWDVPRVLALIAHMGCPIFTLNPNIKSGYDLVGKRVSFGPRGCDMEWAYLIIAKHAWGLTEDKFVRSPMGGGAAVDALLNGTLDAGFTGTVCEGLTGEWARWLPNPATERLLTRAKAYVISFPEEAFKKAAAETGYPIHLWYLGHEALNFGKSHLPRFGTFNCSNSWWVSKDLPDDIVTELLQIIYDHCDEFAKYHATGKFITRANLSTTAAQKRDFHPAALRFFRAKGNKFFEDLFLRK